MPKTNKPRRITPNDIKRKPDNRDARLAEYHQAVEWHFANSPSEMTMAEHDAAIREIARKTGI